MKKRCMKWLERTNRFATKYYGTEGDVFKNKHVVYAAIAVLVFVSVLNFSMLILQ